MRTLLTQLTRFALVGSIGLVIDVTVFNVLRITVLAPENLHEGPVIAKVISTSLAIVANWMGNRHWTFARERRGHLAREGFEFFLVSAGGMLIGLACLWVSHYVLGFDSLLADNISSNVVGLVLGTAFRFWLYRVWVFREPGVSIRPQAAYSTNEETQAAYSTNDQPATSEELRPTEGAVLPTSLAPLHRIQAVSTVDDGTRPHD